VHITANSKEQAEEQFQRFQKKAGINHINILHMSMKLIYECMLSSFQRFQKNAGMNHVNESFRTYQ